MLLPSISRNCVCARLAHHLDRFPGVRQAALETALAAVDTDPACKGIETGIAIKIGAVLLTDSELVLVSSFQHCVLIVSHITLAVVTGSVTAPLRWRIEQRIGSWIRLCPVPCRPRSSWLTTGQLGHSSPLFAWAWSRPAAECRRTAAKTSLISDTKVSVSNRRRTRLEISSAVCSNQRCVS